MQKRVKKISPVRIFFLFEFFVLFVCLSSKMGVGKKGGRGEEVEKGKERLVEKSETCVCVCVCCDEIILFD